MSSTPATFNRQITFCQYRTEYRGFYDHERADKLLQSASQRLSDEVLLDVLADWKSASNAFRLPWLDTGMMEDFYRGYVRHNPTSYERMIFAMKSFFGSKLKGAITDDQLKLVLDQLQATGDEVSRLHRDEAPPDIAEPLWDDLIKHNEYVLSLWSLQNMAFTNLYFGYESGIRKLMIWKTSDPNYRVRDHFKLRADMKKYLWATADTDLMTDIVDAGRVVRNAIAHNGSRVTPEVTSSRVQLCRVEQGMISVLPDHIRKLHDHLMGRLELIATNSP